MKTKNLILKEYDERYASEMHVNVISSKETSKYMLWKPADSLIETQEKLKKWSTLFKIFYLICTKDDEPIGFLSLNEVSPNIYGDLGIAICERYVNKGYGSEILSELIKYITSIGGKKIHYSHLNGNEGSKKLALKFGFEYYKTDKVTRRYDNREFDALFYVLNIEK